jgi:uncharacterized membrane protein
VRLHLRAVAILALVCGASAAGATPLFMGLGDLAGGSFSSSVNAISGDGSTVVGVSASGSGNEAFVWTAAGGMQGLGDVAGGTFSSVANDVSADGSIVVGTGRGASGDQAFRWTAAGGLQTLGASALSATAITRDGTTIVGRTSLSPGAYRWTAASGIQAMAAGTQSNVLPGFPSDLSADGSLVVGTTFGIVCPNEGGERMAGCGWRWRATTGYRHDMSGMGDVNAVSSDGLVLVGTRIIRFAVSDFEQAAVWTLGSGVTSIGVLPGTFNSAALDASADGRTVVGGSTNFSDFKAFIWDPVNGIRDLQQMLVGLGVDLTGWSLTAATAISDDGLTIAGNGINPAGLQEAWVVQLAVPEPSTFALLGAGVVLLLRRRR